MNLVSINIYEVKKCEQFLEFNVTYYDNNIIIATF